MVSFVLDLDHHGSECVHGYQCLHTVHPNPVYLGRSCADAKVSLELGDHFIRVLLLVGNFRFWCVFPVPSRKRVVSHLASLVLAIFPWTALWKMNMKQKEKITICASLSLGVL